MELHWIHVLQDSLRSHYMDLFFIGWNYVDTLEFAILFIAASWYFVKKEVGLRLLYLFSLSSYLNTVLKHFFQVPRPSQVDPTVGVLFYDSLSFPSGAAQTAALIFGVVWLETKNRFYRLCALLFALFLSFSRVYLGAHYPSDILGGWIVGSMIVVAYSLLKKWMKRDETKAVILFPALFSLFGSFAQSALCFGAAAGYLNGAKEWKNKMMEAFFAVAGVAILFKLKSLYPDFKIPINFLAGLWFAAPFFRSCRRCF